MDIEERNSGLSRRQAIAIAARVAALMTLGGSARVLGRDGKSETDDGASRDFDFLFGRWHVVHRSLTRNAAGAYEWQGSEGVCTTRPLLGGNGNCDDHVITAASGTWRGLAVRGFDPEAQQWAIWWLDSRDPHRVDPPLIGAFDGGTGMFYGDGTLEGQPLKLRFVWMRTGTPAPRWEQAHSTDGGATWKTDWIMEFTRVGRSLV